MRVVIRNGRVLDPATRSDRVCDLFLADGRVAGLAEPPPDFRADRVIEAQGLVVCPGLIDLAVRLREPGYEYKATLESEMLAAVAGGVTTLVCPPDTDPPLDEPGLVEMLKHRARLLHQAHVLPLGALTRGLEGRRLTEMAELVDAGCVGFSQADAPLPDTQVLAHALEYAATFGYAVWLRPQDVYLAKGGVAHEGEVALRLGLAGVPVRAETVAVQTMLTLARETGARLHFCRLSAAESLAHVARARAQGQAVSCDVASTHLHLSDRDLGDFDAHYHLVPPLRTPRDRDALRQALAEGGIDAVCSDHTPVDEDAKLMPFAQSETGASGVELLLPLTLKWATEAGLPLAQALHSITAGPARVLDIPAGRLAVGAPADVCVFDPDACWKVTPAALHSQGKNTPFLGLEMQGRVAFTLVSGEVVYETPQPLS